MAIRLVSVSQAVPARDQAAYGNEVGFIDHVRTSAAQKLAETILRDAAVYRRIDPNDDDHFSETRHTWTIGVESDTDAIKLLEHHIAVEASKRASALVAEAIRRIDAWGRDVGWREIKKDDAARFIQEAARHALTQQ